MRAQVKVIASWMNRKIRFQKTSHRKNLQDFWHSLDVRLQTELKEQRELQGGWGDGREEQERRWEREDTVSPGALLAGLFLGISVDPFLLQVRQGDYLKMAHTSSVPSLVKKRLVLLMVTSLRPITLQGTGGNQVLSEGRAQVPPPFSAPRSPCWFLRTPNAQCIVTAMRHYFSQMFDIMQLRTADLDLALNQCHQDPK